MAHIWSLNKAAARPIHHPGPGWTVLPITAEVHHLSATGPDASPSAARATCGAPSALLLRTNASVNEGWAVLGSASVVVNGTPLLTGIRLLADRDEIRVGDGPPQFFSTERPARVEPFPGAGEQTHCARCRTVIHPGTAAVKCPSCARWCHQTTEEDGYQCWTYPGTTACPTMDHPNTLDGALRWSPEEI